MPTWLIRVAIGCGTMIAVFVAMVALAILALYLACGACEPAYNSSASDYWLLVGASPLFLLASGILGIVVAKKSIAPGQNQNRPLPKSNRATRA